MPQLVGIRVCAFHYSVLPLVPFFYSNEHMKGEHMKIVAAIFCLLLVVVTSGIADEKTNATKGKKNPLLVSFSSLIVPGTGQGFNGQPKKGMAFFVAFAVMWGVNYIGEEDNVERGDSGLLFGFSSTIDVDEDDYLMTIGGTGKLILRIWSAIDAFRSARKINQERQFSIAPIMPSKRQAGVVFSMTF